MGNLKRLEIW